MHALVISNAMMNVTPSSLSDASLIEEVKRLAGCERQATAQLVAHLAELDARRLYLGAGYSSLFETVDISFRSPDGDAAVGGFSRHRRG